MAYVQVMIPTQFYNIPAYCEGPWLWIALGLAALYPILAIAGFLMIRRRHGREFFFVLLLAAALFGADQLYGFLASPGPDSRMHDALLGSFAALTDPACPHPW